MSEAIKEHNFKSGQWFYALDGSVYEFINDDVGSRKICEVVDIEKTVFMSAQMKARGKLIAAAPKMYEILDKVRSAQEIASNEIEHSDLLHGIYGEIVRLLAKVRGENHE